MLALVWKELLKETNRSKSLKQWAKYRNRRCPERGGPVTLTQCKDAQRCHKAGFAATPKNTKAPAARSGAGSVIPRDIWGTAEDARRASGYSRVLESPSSHCRVHKPTAHTCTEGLSQEPPGCLSLISRCVPKTRHSAPCSRSLMQTQQMLPAVKVRWLSRNDAFCFSVF